MKSDPPEAYVIITQFDVISSENKKKRKREYNTPEGKCIVCCTEDYNTAVFPCGHLAFCNECWINYSKFDDFGKKKKKTLRCPLCRKDIENSNKVYPA